MMVPTPRALWLVGGAVFTSWVPLFAGATTWVVWLGTSLTVAVMIAVDGLLAIRPQGLEVTVTVPDVLYVGSDDPLLVKIRAGRAWYRPLFELVVDLGPGLAPVSRLACRSSATREAEIQVPLRPLRRGPGEVEAVWLRWSGPFGLMRRVRVERVDESVPMTPNTRAVSDAAIQWAERGDLLSGLQAQRYAGSGSDFEALAEFLPGHDHRAIDWKGSARHAKLLVREYRAERNHNVIIAFDTGRLMGQTLDALPRLDHAINAGLLLSYVCLKTGDRVGLFAFGDRVEHYSAPQGGLRTFSDIEMRCGEFAYGAGETNYTLGLTDLLSRLRRRSLVVVFTDFVDTVTAELMVENIQRVSRRHLVIFVAFRDLLYDETIRAEPTRLLNLRRAVVARELAVERQIVFRRLQRLGVHPVEASPDFVTSRLINSYLAIRRRELV